TGTGLTLNDAPALNHVAEERVVGLVANALDIEGLANQRLLRLHPVSVERSPAPVLEWLVAELRARKGAAREGVAGIVVGREVLPIDAKFPDRVRMGKARIPLLDRCAELHPVVVLLETVGDRPARIVPPPDTGPEVGSLAPV